MVSRYGPALETLLRDGMGFSTPHHPASPDWRERMKLLHLRELLSVLAHFGDLPILCEAVVPRVLEVIATYS
jgi:hypothetical protein